MEEKIANKDSWKNINIPIENIYLDVDIKLNEQEVEILKKGHIPEEMEDKWFMYFEENKFYIHRSWTGFCVYMVFINVNGNIERVQVNRNSEQYTDINNEYDQYMVLQLIYKLIGRKEESKEMIEKARKINNI